MNRDTKWEREIDKKKKKKKKKRKGEDTRETVYTG
jgi:hypothetical protein